MLNVREKIDRYRDALQHTSEARALEAADEQSVRQMERALKVSDETVADAVAANKNIEGLLEMARSRGEDVEPAGGGKTVDPNSGRGLYGRLELLGDVADPKALSVNYRALALGRKQIRACAPWGSMVCGADLGLADGNGKIGPAQLSEVYVDAANFLAVLRNLSEAPFTATVKGDGLNWECGLAHGHLALLDATVGAPNYGGKTPMPVEPTFGPGLELGALACGSSSVVRSAGLAGVQLFNHNGSAYAVASDSTMISSCRLGPALPHADGVVTLKPEAAALLSEVAKREVRIQHGPLLYVGIDRTSLYFMTSDTELHLYQLAPLAHDLAAKLEPYHAHQKTMPLWQDTVAAFLRRAEDLAEVRQQAMVEIAVIDGRTVLTWKEMAGSVEEFYIVHDGPKITTQPARIEARRLVKALAHATELVFDYAEQNILILRGPEEFIFAVSGRR